MIFAVDAEVGRKNAIMHIELRFHLKSAAGLGAVRQGRLQVSMSFLGKVWPDFLQISAFSSYNCHQAAEGSTDYSFQLTLHTVRCLLLLTIEDIYHTGTKSKWSAVGRNSYPPEVC